MAAELITLPFGPALNLQNTVESGALLDVFVTETNTRVPLFSNADLSDSLENPVVADASGRFPPIYWDNTQVVRLRLTTAEGGFIDEVDPFLSSGISDADLLFTPEGDFAVPTSLQNKIRQFAITPEDKGAVALEDGADPAVSQTDAIRRALETGRPVVGNGKTYVIGSSVNPADNTVAAIWNCNFVRAAANQTSQDFMLNLIGQARVKVLGCSFDFGTTENAGSNDDSGRALLAVGSNNSNPSTWLSDIEVSGCSFTGGGNGTALLVRGTKGVRILNNEVTDRVVAGSPANDAQNGIDITHSFDALVQGNRIDELYTRVSGTPTRIYSRGILVTNSQNIKVLGNTVANVDQCIDFSGTISADTPIGNSGLVVANNVCHDYRTWGIKFANCARNGVCEANEIRNFGLGGIVLAGQSGAWTGDAGLATRNILVKGNYIYDPADYDNRTNCMGIWVIIRTAFPGYPVGLQIVDNYIINTTGNGRLLNGIIQVDDDRLVVAGAPYNAVRGNTIIGATAAPTVGCVPDGVCVVTANASQSVANATWTSLEWNVETIDSQAMHSIGANTDRLFPNGAGWYMVTASVAFANNATGIRALRIRKTGASVAGGDVSAPATNESGVLNGLSASCIVYLATTDYVTAEAYQTSGGALNALRPNSQFSIRRLEQMGAT